MEASPSAACPRRPAAWLAAFILSACAPGPVLEYATSDPADRWEAGARLHPAEADGIACTTHFAGYGYGSIPGTGSGRTLRFGVDLRNLGAAPVRIDPRDFRMVSPRLGLAWPAADPEAALADVDRRRTNADGAHALHGCFSSFGYLLSFAARVSEFGNARAQAEIDEMDRESSELDEQEEELYSYRVASLESERAEWSDAHLRRTDLDPGRGMSGTLAFLFPESHAPDTLVLQWTAPGGRQYDLGRYGRPRIAADTLPRPGPEAPRRSPGGAFSP